MGMGTATNWFALVLPCVLASCVDGSESETEVGEELAGEEVDEATQALCIFPHKPPLGFAPNVERSLDGSGTVVRSDGFPAASPCSLYSMGVDTSDGVDSVLVEYETVGACSAADSSAQNALVWRRGGVLGGAWSKVSISMIGDDVGSTGYCHWHGMAGLGPGPYSRVIVAARGEQPDGSPVAPMLHAFETSWSVINRQHVPPPVVCIPPKNLGGADAQGSLDGAATEAIHTGLPTSACDFVKLAVDTNPDRAHEVWVDILSPRGQDVDIDSVEIYTWRRSLASPADWVTQRPNPFVTSSWLSVQGVRVNMFLGASNDFTDIAVAARAVMDDGSPVTSIRLEVSEQGGGL